jgi:branched-chain amino acid transport system ATP-binding protein
MTIAADHHPDAAPALWLRSVAKAYGPTQVLRGIDLAVQAGERLALIGPNGAGKSTLFDLVSGRQRSSAGEIRLHGRRIDGLPVHRIHRLGLARSFQVSQLFPRLTVLQNLHCALLWPLGLRYAFWRGLHGGSAGRQALERAHAVLALFGLSTRADVPAAELSYAEQRALDVAIALAGDARVLLLDEPTAGMSRSETAAFVALLRQSTAGRTLLIVEHDMSVAFTLADRVAVLAQGELIACGTPAEVRADPRVRQAYAGVAASHDGNLPLAPPPC